MDRVFTKQDKINLENIVDTLNKLVNLLNADNLGLGSLRDKTKRIEELLGFSKDEIPSFYIETYIDYFDRPWEEKQQLNSDLMSFIKYIKNKESFDHGDKSKLEEYKKFLVKLELMYIQLYYKLIEKNLYKHI